MKKKVVIVGFGDTGVLVAAHLKKKYDVIAISTKPVLVSGQELGARLTKLEDWKENYLVGFERFKKLDDVTVIHGRAKDIDLDGNTLEIMTSDGVKESLSYDVLVIASGTRNGFWRTDDIRSKDEVLRNLEAKAQRIKDSDTIAIIGAGPTGVSAASSIKETYPNKDVHLVFRQAQILSGYPAKTRDFVTQKLTHQGVSLSAGHNAIIPKKRPLPMLEPGHVLFETGQNSREADCILWAVGETLPNNKFIPKTLLNQQGFVKVNAHLQSESHDNIFSIGDIAATDPNRSSARNAGFQTVAINIDRYLSEHRTKMKSFHAPKYRWGSIMGIQKEGLRIFTPKGGNVKVGSWSVKNILFPVFVHRLIYRGIKKED